MRRLFTLRESPPPLVKRAVGIAGVGIGVLVWFLLTLGSTPETRIVSPVVLPSPLEVLRSIPTLEIRSPIPDTRCAFSAASGWPSSSACR